MVCRIVDKGTIGIEELNRNLPLLLCEWAPFGPANGISSSEELMFACLNT